MLLLSKLETGGVDKLLLVRVSNPNCTARGPAGVWRILRLHQGFRWIIQSYPGYAQTILKGEVGEQRERMNDNLRVD